MTDTEQVWHLSRSYYLPWSPYCDRPHRKGIDFQTFGTERVTCPDCREVARESWGHEKADAKRWGISEQKACA